MTTNQLTTYNNYFQWDNMSLEQLQQQYRRFKESPQASPQITNAGAACGCGNKPAQPKPCGCQEKKEETTYEKLQKLHMVLSFIFLIITIISLLRK